LILLLILPCCVFASTVSGSVTSTTGEPLAYVAVYVKGTSQGTTTNEDGAYSLSLPGTEYTIIFQLLGYKQQTVTVDFTGGDLPLDIVMTPSEFQLHEVVVTDDDEDPAYGIIRKAQAKRKFYLEQVQSFSCDVYIKGIQKVTQHPEKILGVEVDPESEIDSLTGIIYLSESVSTFSFEQPDNIHEEMISSKVSGDNQAFSYNRASDMLFNFYKNVIEIPDLSERGFVSPIAFNAMFYYKYRLVGTFMENDSLVNKIEVIPKRNTDPCFHGYIYIMQNSWRIHSTELYLTKDAQIDFVDTLLVNQVFVPVEPNVWMVFSNRFVFKFGFMGIQGNGMYMGVNQNYVVNPEFPKRYFTGEEMKVHDDANLKDSTYWVDVRPVPLTPEEELDYHRRDSIMRVRNSEAYMDSMDRLANRPTFLGLVLDGYRYSSSYKRFTAGTTPLVNVVSYNSVQGLRVGIDFDITKSWENRKWISLEPAFSYGFGDKRFYGEGELIWRYSPMKQGRISFASGRSTNQFSPRDPVPILPNTVNTLLYDRNLLKIYSKTFAQVFWFSEIINGLNVSFQMDFAKRKPLMNTSTFTFFDWENRDFTSNDPQDPEDDSIPSFRTHRSLDMNLQFSIRFKQKYYTRPYTKIILGSKYPIIGIQFRKGIKGVFGSSTDYNFVKMSVRDVINLKLLGKFSYYVGAGMFLSKNDLPFMDYYHFFGGQTIVSTFEPQSFQLLPYYTYSTNNWFMQAHVEQRLGGMIMNKIPLIRKLQLTEVIGFNWFRTEDVSSYYEVYFGVDKLGVIRVDFALGYLQGRKASAGIRVGLRLD